MSQPEELPAARTMLIEIRDYAVYIVVRVVICVLQTLSLDRCKRGARGLAWLMNDVFRVRHKVLASNLAIAYPHWTEIQRMRCTRRMWEHLFLMLAEIAHAGRKIHRTNWRNYFQFQNLSGMMRLLFDQRPKVIVSGHYGNFELAAYSLGLFGFETYSVARTLDNPYLDKYLCSFRSAKGQHILPKEGSASEIAMLLERRGTLSLLADQHAGPKGCWVEFFGKAASTHKAIALFSLGNQAPLGVSFSRRLGGPLQYQMGLQALADPSELQSAPDVGELTQWFTHELEKMIQVAPEQYWWLHRRWKGEPPARKKKKAA